MHSHTLWGGGGEGAGFAGYMWWSITSCAKALIFMCEHLETTIHLLTLISLPGLCLMC